MVFAFTASCLTWTDAGGLLECEGSEVNVDVCDGEPMKFGKRCW